MLFKNALSNGNIKQRKLTLAENAQIYLLVKFKICK